jgi:hypothetical protein
MIRSTPLPRIQLIGRDNGAGLTHDLQLLADGLRAAGAEVTINGLPHRGRLAEWITRLQLGWRKPAFDINVMVERIRPEFTRAATINLLVPNPEWFDAKSSRHLAAIDGTWVKTHHAERLFGERGVPTTYIGFTSPDRLQADVPRKRAFFHGPGRSGAKGTLALLALWARHPDWPHLTVVWRRKRVEIGEIPANVTVYRELLDDATYRRLQNEHRFHLCPSQTEGFGHYIVEAMSVGAVVVTLDAEPMNELVTPQRGVLATATSGGMQNLSRLYDFDDAAMERAIERCIAMSEEECERLGHAARAWYVANKTAFRRQLTEAVSVDQRQIVASQLQS